MKFRCANHSSLFQWSHAPSQVSTAITTASRFNAFIVEAREMVEPPFQTPTSTTTDGRSASIASVR